ncbi:exodeoxyribonuclease VII small subunit [Sphingobium sp. SJ10-10]|uniref:exodeoxyribonuclease VII small subunit n=1 Tax=unclassified Sphingobium TaxID=2611147 RepID=UPI00077056D3|nr:MULTISPECIES: exodeoxyribonuclease VII small subunit [Sphingomonadaceae]AMK22335.1 exodeoxyribonuclease 7 small subunit [Sphingobium sp. TKS]MEC6699071.1 exodeoxyribonuclease VII small subunit [Sphingobium sp. SJ10-10]NML88464.1 exodeoxyribonuclease VII small subunit [Sphingobium sp. TB-6]
MAQDSNIQQGDPSQMSFEDALRALESIVRRLESGDVPLDESISLYSQGELLRKRCMERLQAAEARIAKLTLDADGAVTGAQPFGTD